MRWGYSTTIWARMEETLERLEAEWQWPQTVVDTVMTERGKRQKKNVAVDAVKSCPTAVSLFGALVQQKPQWRDHVIDLDARYDALHYTANQPTDATLKHNNIKVKLYRLKQPVSQLCSWSTEVTINLLRLTKASWNSYNLTFQFGVAHWTRIADLRTE